MNRKINILLVEDSPGDVELFKGCLDNSDNIIHVALLFSEIDDIIKQYNIDIAFLDVNYPDGEGLGILEKFKTLYPIIPVVALTSMEDEKHGLDAIGLGAQDYLTKNEITTRFISRSIHCALQRKKLENNLIDEVEKSRCYFDNSNVIMLVINKEGIVEQINIRGLQLLGTEKSNIVGKNWFENFIEDSEKGKLQEYFESLFTSNPDIGLKYENKIVAGNGEIKFISWANSIIRNDNGDAVKILCSGTDISGKNKILDELKLSESELKETQKLAGLGTWKLDIVNNSLEWSAGIYNLFGVSTDNFEANYEAFINLVHPDDRKYVDQTYKISVETKKPYDIIHRIVKHDKSIIWVREICSTTYDDKGNPIFSKGVVQDITTLKISQQKLSQTEDLYQSVFDNSGTAILIVNSAKKIVNANLECEIVTGYSRSVLIGTSWVEYVSKDSLDLMIKYNRDRIDGKKDVPKRYEVKLVHSSGEIRYAIIGVELIPQSENMVVSLLDITERKNAEHSLFESEERFQLAMNASNDGLYDWNLKTNEIYYSPAWKKMLGYEYHELENDFSIWENLVHPTGLKKTWSMLKDHFEGRLDRFELEFKMRHKKGHWVDILSRAEASFDSSGKPVRVVGTHIDISARKKAENLLKKSEKGLKKAQNIGKLGNWEWDFNRSKISWSEELYKIWEWDTNTELTRENIISKIHPEDRELNNTKIDQIISSHDSGSFEFRILLPDNTVKTINQIIEVRRNKNGDILRLFGVMQDITDRKKIEEELENSKKDWENIFEAIGHPTIILDANHKIIDTNKSVRELTGKVSEELKGLYCYDVFHHSDVHQPTHNCPLQVMLKSGKNEVADVEMEAYGKNYLVSCTPVFDNQGIINKIIHISTDITERKQVEKQLKLSEFRYRELLNTISSGVAIYKVINDGMFGTDYIVQEFNLSALKIERKKSEEVVGKSLAELRPTIDEYGLIPVLRRVWKTGEPSFFPAKIYVDDNYSNYYENRVFKLPSGEIVSVYDDVTERKLSDIVLENAFTKYKSLFDNMLNGFALHEVVLDSDGEPIDYIFLEVNRAFEKITGLEANKIIGEKVTDVLPGIENDPANWIKIYGDVAKNSSEIRFENYSIQLDKWHSVLVYSPARNQFATVIEDISDRKHAENSLKESERKLNTLISNLPGMAYRCKNDNDWTMIFISQGCEEILGYSANELVNNRDLSYNAITHPDDRKMVSDTIQNAVSNNEAFRIEYRIIDRNGRIKWMLENGKAIDNETGYGQILEGYITDISYRIEAEKIIMESENRLKLALKAGNQGIFDLDLVSGNSYVSEEYVKMLGYKQKDIKITIESWKRMLHPDDFENTVSIFEDYLAGKVSEYNVTFRQMTASGKWKWILSNGQITEWSFDGKPLRIMGTHTDIDKQKNIELKLDETNELLNGIINSAPVAIIVIDNSGIVKIWNPAAEKIFGWTFDEVKDKFLPIIPDRDVKFIQKLQDDPEQIIVNFEGQRRRNDGVIIEVSISSAPIYDENHKVSGYLRILSDISERKYLESELLDSLKEKDTLLKEVHHRVKNNMQIITSLLNIQANSIKDNNIRQALYDSQSRIKSMALVHEKLYKSSDLSKINTKAYLEDLIVSIKNSYAESEATRITLDSDEIFMSANVVVPLGLVINELISNAIKYAYDGPAGGEIFVSTKKINDKMKINIKDFGKGFEHPEDISKLETLGLPLINDLIVNQLDGTYELLTSDKGTEYIIEILIENNDEQ